MAWIAAAVAATTAIGGAFLSSKSSDKAADAGEDAAELQVGYARETRDLIRSDTQPQREAGYTALNALMGLTGLQAPASVQTAAVAGTPTGGGAISGAISGGDTGLSGGGTEFGEIQRGGLIQLQGITTNKRQQVSGVGRNRQVFVDQATGDLFAGDPNTGLTRIGNVSNTAGEGGTILGIQAGGKAVRFNNGQLQTGRGEPLFDFQPTGTVTDPGEGALSPATGQEFIGGSETNPATGTALTPAEMVRSDPSYDFRLNEGIRARDRSASAAGGLLSGGYGRKLTRYAQDYASTEYTNIYNRISNIAGFGQVAQQGANQGALAYGGIAAGAAGDAGYTRDCP